MIKSFTPEELSVALCAQIGDVHLFFSESGDNRPAKRVCRRCPLFKNGRCLDIAMTNREEYGIWAATTGTERKASWK